MAETTSRFGFVDEGHVVEGYKRETKIGRKNDRDTILDLRPLMHARDHASTNLHFDAAFAQIATRFIYPIRAG